MLALPFAVAATLVASALPAGAAVEVPAAAIWTMAGTPDGSRVFVGAVEAGLLVVDSSGTNVSRVAGIGRTVGIRMGEDGRTLWVGLPNDRQIAAVDATTLTVTARYNVGSDICPGDVSQTGRFVAFGFSCFIYSDEFLPPTPTGIGVLDTQTGTVRWTVGPIYQPIVATSPGLPGRVLWTDYGVHEVSLGLLDVSSGTPQSIATRKLGMINPGDLAVSPDGREVAVTGVGGGGIHTFTTTDLSPILTYATTCASRSVGWSADSSQLATMCNGQDYKVALFARGNPNAVRTAGLAGGPERTPVNRGMVLSADAGRATIGTRDMWQPRMFVDRIGLRPAAATVSGPSTGYATQPATFTARLLLDGTPAPTGTAMLAYREQPFNSTLLGTYLTDASGSVTFTDAPPSSGSWSYRVHFPGNDDYARTDGAFALQVERLPTSLSIAYQTGKKRRGTMYGSVVVTLGPTVGHRLVTVTATTASGTQPVTSQSAPTNAPLVVPYPINTPTTFTVTYDGNSWQQPATATISASP
jgi:hypothetical protein